MAAMREVLLPISAEPPSDRQQLFTRYFAAILVDLVVLNLFGEYSSHVAIKSFTASLLAAAMLQLLLKLTMAVKHSIASALKDKPGVLMLAVRLFCVWLVLFGSKFVILEALSVFGRTIRFTGPADGLVVLTAVVFTMVVMEEALVRLHAALN